MANKTLGTTGNTSLSPANVFIAGYQPTQTANTDFAAISLAIKDDLNVAHPVMPGSYTPDGQLFVPNRGVLRVLPGDWVGVDNEGWPILVSAYSIANGHWVHS